MCFVHDQQVPGEVGAVLVRLGSGAKFFEHVCLAEIVVGGNDARKLPPRVGVWSEALADVERLWVVDDVDTEAIFPCRFRTRAIEPTRGICGMRSRVPG